MAIINRLSRLFRADIHAVLDKLEDPEIQLRYAIREMQACLKYTQADLANQDRHLATLQEQLTTTQTRLEKLDQELDICFASAKEELARSLVKRKLHYQQSAHYLQKRLKKGRDELEQQAAEITENRARLESLKQKADLFHGKPGGQQARQHSEPDSSSEFSSLDPALSEDDIEIAFLQEKNMRAVQ